MILYTTCSLRPENTIHSDQQNKKSHPLCVLYPTLPIKKNVFCSTIHRRKMPKNILQITSHHVFKYHHWTIFYKTKTNFSCWLVFKKIHNGRRCIVVYSFLFFLKKSCDPIESTQVLSWWWWRRNFFALSLILLSGYIFLLRKKKFSSKWTIKHRKKIDWF